jgi:CHAT domain-containing protein/tetratricopeptide (TPR) repeat protein
MFKQITPFANSRGWRWPTTRRAILIINVLLWVALSASPGQWPGAEPVQASAGESGAEPSAQESISLEPDKPVERELPGGQSHSYKVMMVSGQYLRIVVVQRGTDVVVSLFTPDGKKISETDSENITEGSETLSAIAEAPGAYLIEVRSSEKTAKAGRYEIKVEELRAATTEDKYRVTAESVLREAEQLQDGTLEDKRKSLEKYHEALELYRKAGYRKGEADTLNNIAGVYRLLGEMRKALEKLNEALLISHAVGDRVGEAKLLNNIGRAYDVLGEIEKALEKYNEVLPISRALGNRKGEAITLNNIGLAYETLGELQKALEKYNEALPITREIGYRDGEATTLSNIGAIYHFLGEMQNALQKYNEALPISRATGDRSGEAITLSNIGAVYSVLGDAQKALETYSETLPIFQELGDRSSESNVLNNIGSIYSSIGEIQKALDKYNKALLINQAVGEPSLKASILNNLGQAYKSSGEMRKALEKYNEALPIFRAIGNRKGEADTLTNIGIAYTLGEPQKALEKFNEALPIRRDVGDRRGQAETLHGIGIAYQSQGETQKALEKFNEALPIRRGIGDRSGEATTLLGIARVEQTRGNLTQARQTVEQAVGLIESQRTNIVSQELRASYFASRQEFFETYIDVLMEQHRENPAARIDAVALAVSERARARSLLELLKEARADIRQGVDRSLLERERSSQQLLNAKAAAQARLLNRKHTSEQAAAAAKEIAAISTEYDEVQAQIRARSPRYAALTQPQPLGLTEIQQQVLDPDTLLLEYSLGNDASYLFVVSQTSITSHVLPKRAEIEAAARRVRELLTALQPQPGDTDAKYQARVKEAEEDYWTQAAELSRMLLGPAAPQLGKKRLAIVADGALQYIPFAALPSPSPKNGEGRNSGAEPQPLLIEHEIVSLPSASTLATLRSETAGRKPAEKTLAVLADPVFADDDTRVRQNTGKALAQTKTRSADSEVVDVVSLQMTRSGRETGVIGAEAGFGRLINTRREATAILALNNVHPELSGIVLSLVDEAGKPKDGFLRLQDIYNLKLQADLVVLSACQTGLGKEIKGEGLIGLTRGFMYAGAPRIVASLWKVDDRATSELMQRFYQGMLGPEALSVAGALRQAQLSIWKQKRWREPYYWAAFILQGEWK